MKYTDVQLFDEVLTNYYATEKFTVVGIREHELELRGDWSAMNNIIGNSWYPIEKCKKVKTNNLEKMYAVVFDKYYRNKGLRKWLLATGDKLLVDGNDRNDKVWGIFEGEGENMLGKILMQIRNDFKFINSYGN